MTPDPFSSRELGGVWARDYLSILSFSTQGTYETSRDVPCCPSTQLSVPPVHPIPQSPRDIWDIKGHPMVSLNTIVCPTCPSYPSVPKGHMGHQGTSHGVLQHNSPSHLSHPLSSSAHVFHQYNPPLNAQSILPHAGDR